MAGWVVDVLFLFAFLVVLFFLLMTDERVMTPLLVPAFIPRFLQMLLGSGVMRLCDWTAWDGTGKAFLV